MPSALRAYALVPLMETIQMRMTRYFHYLSTAKVNMLYDQLDMSLSTRSTRLGFDLKVLAANHEIHRTGPDPSLYGKLRAVEEAIERSEPPGSLEEPEPYIRDGADVWSIVIPSRKADSETDLGSDTVLFCGESRGGRPFVLGGAAAHMLPSSEPTGRVLNSSFFYLQREVRGFVANLTSDQGEFEVSESSDNERSIHEQHFDNWSTTRERLDVEPFMYDSIKYLAELHRVSNNELTYVGYSEFLARVIRVVHPTADTWSPAAVLATPLYVCQIETSGQLRW